MIKEEQVIKILKEKVDPILEKHFGGAELSGVEDGIVKVKLTGACGTCPSAQYTVEEVIKSVLMDEIDEVNDVILDTSVSSELLDMARKMMRH